jgi:hypothetical protein
MAKTFSALATSAAFASVVFGGGGGIVISTLRKVMVAFEQRCTSVAKEDRSVRPREED